MTIKELRTEITKMLLHSDEASADASIIIMHSLGIDKTRLILGNAQVSDSDYKKVLALAERAAGGEPVQYIVGECEFMSLPFKIKKGVLIPRPDTEVLVEAVTDRLNLTESPQICDICCGSGCIGLSLVRYLPTAFATLLDISSTAVEVSTENARSLNLSSRCKILTSDITKDPIEGEFDCVVSNPPYIKTEVIETLDRKVVGFEPHLALDGGDDGLDFYRIISQKAPLKPKGLLAFEIGFDQGDAVSKIMNDLGYTHIEIIKDIENRDRVVLGYNKL